MKKKPSRNNTIECRLIKGCLVQVVVTLNQSYIHISMIFLEKKQYMLFNINKCKPPTSLLPNQVIRRPS